MPPPVAAPTGPATVTDVSSFTPEQKAAFDSAAKLSGGAATSTTDPSKAQNALLVTSNTARTNFNNNATKLQTVTSGMQNGNATSQVGAGGQPNVTPSTTSTSNGGTTINIHSPGSTPDTATSVVAPSGSAPAGSAPTPAGATPGGTPTPAGATSTQTPAEANAQAVAGIKDPGLASMYKTQLDNFDSQATTAQSNIDSAKATLANDPAATAAIDAIKAKYEQQISLMKSRNAQVMGRNNTSMAAFGGLGPMSQDFLNDQQAKADQRISDLQTQEQSLILKAQIAYQTKDSKALNDAMTAYDKVNADKLKAINTLLQESDKQVSQMQAQARIDATTSKNAIAADISKSANLGTSIAKNIADSGITDKGQISQYVASMAEQYGISNPDILQNAVDKASAAAEKQATASANTADIIKNRDITTANSTRRTNYQVNKPYPTPKGPASSKPKTDGGLTYTQDEVKAISDTLTNGLKKTDGTVVYAGRGTDGFVDPGTYTNAYTAWTKNGGTTKGFVKEFPINNVNPSSYSVLPAALQPKTKAASNSSIDIKKAVEDAKNKK